MASTRRTLLLGTGAALVTGRARAQNFPSKPIRLVVPYSPGGGADTTARLIAPKLQEALGETVVVDNRPGAGGMIGDETVAKAAPDGHTLLIGAFAHAVNPSLFAKMPFRTPDDFAPISLLVTVPELLVITPSHPAKTVAELVAMAKAQPGKLFYASSGNGSAQHLAAELFKLRTGTDIGHVPYKGGGLAIVDVAAGHVPFYFGNMSAALPQARGGKVRALAVTSAAALAGRARRADHRRSRRQGLRDLRMERPDRPGRHAARRAAAPARRGRENHAPGRHQGQVRRPRRRRRSARRRRSSRLSCAPRWSSGRKS